MAPLTLYWEMSSFSFEETTSYRSLTICSDAFSFTNFVSSSVTRACSRREQGRSSKWDERRGKEPSINGQGIVDKRAHRNYLRARYTVEILIH